MMPRGRKPHIWTAEQDEALAVLTLEDMRTRFGISWHASASRRAELGIVIPRGQRPELRPTPVPKVEPDKVSPLVELLMEAGGSIARAARLEGVSKQAIGQRIESARERVRQSRGNRAADLTGQRFGRLKAILDTGRNSPNGRALWLCSCRCGKAALVRADNLTSGHAKSCGCLKEEAPGVRLCECGVWFPPRHKTQVACSPACQAERKTRQNRERAARAYRRTQES